MAFSDAAIAAALDNALSTSVSPSPSPRQDQLTDTIIVTTTASITLIDEKDSGDSIYDDDDDDAKSNDGIAVDVNHVEVPAIVTQEWFFSGTTRSFRVGDHVRLYKRALGVFPFYHHGIVTSIRVAEFGERTEGQPARYVIDRVAHFTHRNNRARQVICETSWYHFAEGAVDPCEIVDHTDDGRYSLAMAAKRAKAKIGCSRYHFVQRNCEHFATWCHTGRENSTQIRTYAQVAVALSWGAMLGMALSVTAQTEPSPAAPTASATN